MGIVSQTDGGGQWSQYSPDGKWWWDGQQWVPVTGGRAVGRVMERAFEPRRMVRRIIIGRLIGCAIAVLILGAVAAVVLLSVLSVSLR
jgi:hypothetical protein